MEQRRDVRFAGSQSAWITLYGTVDTRIPGRIRNISGRGIGLEIDQPVATGTAIKIEVSDSMLLGEALYCRQENGCFFVGVHLDQALRSLVALSRNVSEFTAAPSTREQTHAMQQTNGEHKQQPR